MKSTYILENLNCAHCAAKIEQAVSQTQGFENVSFNFATKQMKLSSNRSDTLQELQRICDSIEDGVTVRDEQAKPQEKREKGVNSDFILFAVSASLALIALVLNFATDWFVAVQAVSVISALLAGYRTFLRGIKSVFKLKLDEATLLTIAVAAAFILGEGVEAAMVTVLFTLGEMLEDRAVEASRRDIEKLAQIRPDTATIFENGKEKTVQASTVAVGSVIIVKPYERVPLDGVIVEGSTSLDMSALTGESMPVEADCGFEALSGAINGGTLIKMRTTKEFSESTATRILRLVEDGAAQKGEREKLISRFSGIYTPIVILISIAIAFIPPILGLGELSVWIYRALVCLVASCPCAIVISVPLAYFSGIGAASRQGVLIKGGKYLEALAKADTFVFDKTGTLTSGKLSVNRVISTSELSEKELLALAAACEKYSQHPAALAIKQRAQGLELPRLDSYSESAGRGTSAMLGDSIINCGGAKILSESQKRKAPKNASVFILRDNELAGAIEVSDTIRPEAAEVTRELKRLGVKKQIMLTGDTKQSAETVSNALKLDMCKSECMPADKLNTVQELKHNSSGVCFAGDGINDAPVLTASDCGIAMGLGSEAAIEAADVVLSSGNLKQLPNAVKIARRVMKTVKVSIAFALAVKAAVIILAALGLAAMWMSVIADTGVTVACVLYVMRNLMHNS